MRFFRISSGNYRSEAILNLEKKKHLIHNFSCGLCFLPQKIKLVSEESKKNRPICKDLILWAKDCDLDCPYRHIVTENNDTFVPNYGFVNMELIEVLAPNHYSVRVFSHKRKLIHKSKPVDNFNKEFKQFDETMCGFYADEYNLKKPSKIEVGVLYLMILLNKPKRCRTISISKNTVHIYLIDTGKATSCTETDLFYLDEEFHTFPSLAVEVFVLGIVPSDLNANWIPDAKPFVEKLLEPLKGNNRMDKYLQAKVIRSFDRTLIVKDLNLLIKKDGKLQIKDIAHTLIKYQLAEEKEISLHMAFEKMVKSMNDLSELMTICTDATDREMSLNERNNAFLDNNNDMNVITSNRSNRSSYGSSSDKWSKKLQNAPNVNEADATRNNFAMFCAQEQNIINNVLVQASASAHSSALNQQEEAMGSVQNDRNTLSSFASLDEIMCSLPSEVQSMEVLTPIPCTNDKDWLIDFSE